MVRLYDADAVMQPGSGQIATGVDEIRGVLAGFLTLNPTFEMHSTDVLKSGDVALLYTKWTLKGTDPKEARSRGRALLRTSRGARPTARGCS